MNGIGRTLMLTGLLLMAIGAIISLSARLPWLGKLPGDIYLKKENFSFYFPLTTCILVSALFSLVLWLLRR